jgi:hypothetical protein
MKKFWLTLILAFSILSGSVSASKEGLLALKAFALESPGIGESGPVKISGAQSSSDITLLRIEAFDKTFNIGPDLLRQLRGFNANGVQITYEGGYVDLGGRTIYVIFSRGFTSGAVVQRYVAVTESGSVTVADRP